MRKPTEPIPYERWRDELLSQPFPDETRTIEEIERSIGITGVDGSWESLYERYMNKEKRSRARRRK